jgi:hypothetical protein
MGVTSSLARLSVVLAVVFASHAVQAGESAKRLTLNVLERTTEPLLKPDRPWEESCVGYCTVLRADEQWHLWYSSYDRNYRDDNDSYLCYARSKDGVHWEKPSLGVYSYRGSTNNNILGFGTHGVSVFLDEKAPPAERFKAVGVRQQAGHSEWWLFGAASSDGIHWKWLEEPLLKRNSDTENVCIPDGDVYRLYVRMWSGPTPFSGQRIVGYSQSARFSHFSDPTAILSTDKDDPPKAQFYNSAATKLSSGLYLMLPSALLPDGTLSVHSAFSRDGKQFCRLGRKPLLGPGQGFDSEGVYVGPGAVPGQKPGTYWFYYLGVSAPHDEKPANSHSNGGIGRFLLNIILDPEEP